MREQPIIVTEGDARRLRALLGRNPERSLRDQEHLLELQSELERALVLDAPDVPADVITMRTHVQVLDLASGERIDYVLAYPTDANVSEHRISILAPLGTALLGYREGDEVAWEMPGGPRRLRIERVIQPAAPTPGARGARLPMTASAFS